MVMSYFQKLGSPEEIGKSEHKEKFFEMLKELDLWAENQGFSNWKRSAISGSIEGILRNTYRNTGVDDIVSAYLEASNKIIMKM